MSEWKDLAHFLYGRGFWYVDPIREIDGLSEEQLFWTPGANALCMLWQVGHIAHREQTHLGGFLQGPHGTMVVEAYEVFGPDWCSTEQVRASIDSVQDVLEWVRDVREKSHAYIASLSPDDFHSVPPASEGGLSVAHWVFITVAHTASHVGRIQLLRALLLGQRERAC